MSAWIRPLVVAGGIVAIFLPTCLWADGSGPPAAVSSTAGQYSDKDGNPTFNISKDGTVDWYTSIGYTRYTANCMQCHGPDGLGSSFGPALTDALQTLSYSDFVDTVTNGKKNVSASQDLVMPSFGVNPNVMCYLDAIFIYLRARSDDALGRGKPQKSEPRPPGYSATEDACMG
ncbi:c-type cytochrome, methanol metabolism-related [Starkeya sp. ORNL1]|uniref:c-type cytochrome, methanol metabolism-related n=1 Tax=Starkeya sp. ORNL1 TaxID=2709380 RepID=UPI0014644E04|nr:c-type cytochrome, methanol metabolism-related [Starkeya sp. ORNL1]QJP17136.1 c-type cytochrome, methanol metabolism-related [Starkeya sp. ORNL1]